MNNQIFSSAVDSVVSVDIAQVKSDGTSQLRRVSGPDARSWLDNFARQVKGFGLRAVLGVASMGFGGAVAVQRAEAGLVTMFGSTETSSEFGSSQVVSNGGNLLWFSVEFTNPETQQRDTIYSSAVVLGDGRTIVNQTHQYRPFLSLNPIFSVGTGSNYLDPNLRGSVFRIESFALDPAYQNAASYASTHGLAVGISEFQIPVANDLVVGTAMPGDVLYGAGFGVQGNIGGDSTVTGAANGGIMFTVPTGGNFASELSIQTLLSNSPSNPQSWSALTGDSGLLQFNERGEWTGSGQAGNGQGGATWSTRIGSQSASAFIDDNRYPVTSIPEPGSFGLATVAGLLLWLRRKFSRNNCSPAEA